MKLSISTLLIILLSVLGCQKSEKDTGNKYLQKDANEWKNYLEEIGVENDLYRQVFLIIQTVECAPCLQELEWWNNEGNRIQDLGLNVIIIEKYRSSIETFTSTRGLIIPVYQDSSGQIFDRELIPYTPIKVFFDESSNLLAMEKMGAGGRLNEFVKIISDR
jgi:hypothetical protein